jgi:hypothetical protein
MDGSMATLVFYNLATSIMPTLKKASRQIRHAIMSTTRRDLQTYLLTRTGEDVPSLFGGGHKR